MTDKKLTDNEIKKALECCIKSRHFGECFENKCPLISEDGCKVGKETLYPYALDLINRQKAEIERLSEYTSGRVVQMLTERDVSEEIAEYFQFVEEIKAEAYKEFAERLKELLGVTRFSVVDDLVKEMVGEK